MVVPSTYGDWIDALEELKTVVKDPKYIEILGRGTNNYNEATTKRLIDKIDEVVRVRLKTSLDKFIGKLSYIVSRPTNFNFELLELKKEFYFVYSLCSLPVIPEINKEKLRNSIKMVADANQITLEEQVNKIDGTGQLLSILKNNRINNL